MCIRDRSAGATHPAIFSMVPGGKKPIKTAAVTHDEDHGFWILNVPAPAKTKAKTKAVVNLKFIAIGRSPE